MKNAKNLLLLCGLLIGSWLSSLHAQNGHVTAGGDLTGSGGTVSYSIGQIDYCTIHGSGGSTYQGLQQPYEIWVVTGVEVSAIELTMSVFPNPTADYVMLHIEYTEFENLSYTLTDMSGKLLSNQKLSDPMTQISLTQYSLGVYLLNVMENGSSIKSFKIVKNQ